MKLRIWICVEVSDQGGVKVSDGSWQIMKDDASEKMPDGDAAATVAHRFESRVLPEVYSHNHAQGHTTNGRPAERTPMHQVLASLQEIGVGPGEGTELCQQHGAGRVLSLLKWISQKDEPVANPLRLLLSILSKDQGGKTDRL